MSRQQKRLQRESEIIAASLELLEKTSFLDLKMSEVAKAAECSMGVIYSHFSSKEDLLLACCHHNIKSQMHILELVLNTNLSHMERLVLCGLVNWHHDIQNPSCYQLRQLAMNPAVWHRASPVRNQSLDLIGSEIERQLIKVTMSMLEEQPGFEADQATANQMVFGFWGMINGLFQIQQSGFGILNPHVQENDGIEILLQNIEHFGIGWNLERKIDMDRLVVLNQMAKAMIEAAQPTKKEQETA